MLATSPPSRPEPAPAAAETPARPLPYAQIGGKEAIERIVNRFYDLMEHDPHFARLRAMHGADLAPMRVSLAGFLCGWLGGPRDWFDERGGFCLMSAHARLPISEETATEWQVAMAQALRDCQVDPVFSAELLDIFGRIGSNIGRRRGR